MNDSNDDKPIPAPPVAGYQDITKAALDLVNGNKLVEEHVLRIFDKLTGHEGIDQRWLAIGRTHVEQGFMALNRSIFRPSRIVGDISTPRPTDSSH